MKILVTGTAGQLSRCLQERSSGNENVDLVALGRPDLDLLCPQKIASTLATHQPDVVVSAAAYTAVDDAEDQSERAYAINEVGAGAVAAAAKSIGAPVIHLSTDYVFSGNLNRPYTEQDQPNPVNVYGASKLAGEDAVAAANDRHIILRTSSVFSPFGRNFVLTVQRLAQNGSKMSMINDQWSNPTYAFDLADAVISIAAIIKNASPSSQFGVFHLTGKSAVSWFDFADGILALTPKTNNQKTDLRPIPAKDYSSNATRPTDSRLCSRKAADVFSIELPSWESALKRMLAYQRNGT